MHNFAKLKEEERRIIINEIASHKGTNPLILDKDFWVCWALKLLFGIEEIKEYIVFKGGTSLSKVYNLIERFSEDIDITIDRKAAFFENKDINEIGISRKEITRRKELIKKK